MIQDPQAAQVVDLGRVVVFCASGRPGLAQARLLLAMGHDVRVITRRALPHHELRGAEAMAADLNDPASVRRACEGADVVFYTAPTFAERSKGERHIALVGASARKAGVRRVVYNTTTWHPDERVGVPTMDRRYLMTAALQDTGIACTIVRPSLFMDNLLTDWVRPQLLDEGVFAYPHAEDLHVSWISLDDVARYMIATAGRAGDENHVVDIGGPEGLRPTQVAHILGEVLRRPIRYRRLSPREFGERMYALFSSVTDIDREQYVSELQAHYEFKNAANPFFVPMDETSAHLGVEPESLRQWSGRQTWHGADPMIGSGSG